MTFLACQACGSPRCAHAERPGVGGSNLWATTNSRVEARPKNMTTNRRRFGLGLVKAAASLSIALPADAATASLRQVNAVDAGADPTGKADSAAAIQSAIDTLAATGGALYFPAGDYRVSRTLKVQNPVNDRSSGILFIGDGMHSTRLRSTVSEGPLLQIRGVPAVGPVNTTFFWGGGIQQMTLDGSAAAKSGHDAIEVMGWWYGELSQLRIHNFSRHGIRATTDLALNTNPDFSASTLFVKAVWIERCGGWGYKDDGGVQGSPAWTWSHTVFVLCGEGGAYVQSSSHTFTKCSFAACGWRAEDAKPQMPGYGLYFDGAVTPTSRQWVEGCEFDTNHVAHIGLRYASVSTFINNRFIFNDRYNAGKLCPAVGVEIGSGDARAAVRNVEFRQSFFRFDKGGNAVGFDWANTANVSDVLVQRSIFSAADNNALVLVRYRGAGDASTKAAKQYRIED